MVCLTLTVAFFRLCTNVKLGLPYQRKKTRYLWNLAQHNLNFTRIKPYNKQECKYFTYNGDAETLHGQMNVLLPRLFGRTNKV